MCNILKTHTNIVINFILYHAFLHKALKTRYNYKNKEI